VEWPSCTGPPRACFLAAIGADEIQIEASFSEAIRTRRGRQKSVSLARTGRKQLTRNTVTKKRAGQENVDFRLPSLLTFLQLSVLRSTTPVHEKPTPLSGLTELAEGLSEFFRSSRPICQIVSYRAFIGGIDKMARLVPSGQSRPMIATLKLEGQYASGAVSTQHTDATVCCAPTKARHLPFTKTRILTYTCSSGSSSMFRSASVELFL